MTLASLCASSDRAIALLEPAFGPTASEAVRQANRAWGRGCLPTVVFPRRVVVRRGHVRIRQEEDPDLVLAWSIAEVTRKARTDRGWRQEDLAARSGMAQPNIVRLERGQHLPSLPTLRRVARALDLDLRTLLAPPEERMVPEDRALAEAGLGDWATALDVDDRQR